jgi:hypothetical protein
MVETAKTRVNAATQAVKNAVGSSVALCQKDLPGFTFLAAGIAGLMTAIFWLGIFWWTGELRGCVGRYERKDEEHPQHEDG